MFRRHATWVIGLAILSTTLGTFAQGQSGAGGKKKPAAAPPKFDDSVKEAFFNDARDKLSGERPKYGKSTGGGATAGGTSGGSTGDAPAATGGGSNDWSKIVSAETLENEIKSSAGVLSEIVKSPQKFKGGGHKVGRMTFSVDAIIFGVIAEYNGNVRWKDKAAAIRDQFTKAGVNCKVATDLAFKEAKDRAEELNQMVRGSPPAAGSPDDFTGWGKVSDRPPLMQKMEHLKAERLLPMTANAGEFNSKKDALLHEAQILAVLARVIQDQSFEYASDTGTYQESAKAVESGALAIVEAVKQGDAAAAQKAAAEIGKACDRCHGEYR